MTTHALSNRHTSGRLPLWWLAAAIAGFVGGMTFKAGIDLVAEIGRFTATLDHLNSVERYDPLPDIPARALTGALGIPEGFVAGPTTWTTTLCWLRTSSAVQNWAVFLHQHSRTDVYVKEKV